MYWLLSDAGGDRHWEGIEEQKNTDRDLQLLINQFSLAKKAHSNREWLIAPEIGYWQD